MLASHLAIMSLLFVDNLYLTMSKYLVQELVETIREIITIVLD